MSNTRDIWADLINLADAASQKEKLAPKIKLRLKRERKETRPEQQNELNRFVLQTKQPASKKTKPVNPFVLGSGLSPFALPTQQNHELQPGNGFVRLRIENQTIYIASTEKAEMLAARFNIPEENQVDLSAIPDKDLAQDAELHVQFITCVSAINPNMDTVILHCFDGLSRAPLAALTYMIANGMQAGDARDNVVQAMQARDNDFQLDPKGYYPTVLQALNIEQSRRRTYAGSYAE